jgi:hypothetical protein
MQKKNKQTQLITAVVVIFAVIIAFALFAYLVLPYFLGK